MPNAAMRLAEARASVKAEARRKVAARKAKQGKGKPAAKKASAPKRAKGITNIIRRRSTQANRAVKKALGN
jgi:hypothetical protein